MTVPRMKRLLLWSSLAVPKTAPGEASVYAIPMAPRVAKGKVFIGNAGGEFPGFRGYVSAFDVNTGKELWKFYTVPGDPSKGFENKAMEAAAKTWTGEQTEAFRLHARRPRRPALIGTLKISRARNTDWLGISGESHVRGSQGFPLLS